MSKKLVSILILLLFTSCAHVRKNSEHQVMSTLWAKSSGEFRALAYQAYNLAKIRLDQSFNTRTTKKRAIILDVDETVLDNTPFAVESILLDAPFSTHRWDKWVLSAKAEEIPGAAKFLNYAHKRGIEIFYISNRSENKVDATYKNLKTLGIPAKKRNMFFKGKIWSKEERRSPIFKNYNVIMLFGDNLSDFHPSYDHISPKKRVELTNSFKKMFGKKFIVFPNPMYGDWESSLYDHNNGLNPVQKSKKRTEELLK